MLCDYVFALDGEPIAEIPIARHQEGVVVQLVCMRCANSENIATQQISGLPPD